MYISLSLYLSIGLTRAIVADGTRDQVYIEQSKYIYICMSI